MGNESPIWVQRIRALREARGLSQSDAAKEMRIHARKPLPGAGYLFQQWIAWESGESKPSGDYAPLIAATLGTVTAALFPPVDDTNAGMASLSVTGVDTVEIISRLKLSDINEATFEGLRLIVEKLCAEYAYRPPSELIHEGRQWLRRIITMPEKRLSSRQRRATLELAGWLTLLVGCLEYDLGDKRAAESTRKRALSLGLETGNSGILGWAHEMQAWFAITSGDYQGAIAAATAGQLAAQNHSVSVQLLAQEAKAWARMDRPEEMKAALERGRITLENLPYPNNIDNHFVVDPAKYDFYAMDCYRYAGQNRLAATLADEIIRDGTNLTGNERNPMRVAEAHITLGVVAAREGDLEAALSHGRWALAGPRKSLPSLTMVSQDLTAVLSEKFSGLPDVDAWHEELRTIRQF